jgi:hypothetical protein
MNSLITTGNGNTAIMGAQSQTTNQLTITQTEISPSNTEGIKDDTEKLYYELDWEFIENMAKTMSDNKSIYPKWNWQKPMPDGIERLKQSLIRHVIEILKGNYSDNNKDFGHFYSVALNAMMIHYQIKNNGKQ